MLGALNRLLTPLARRSIIGRRLCIRATPTASVVSVRQARPATTFAAAVFALSPLVISSANLPKSPAHTCAGVTLSTPLASGVKIRYVIMVVSVNTKRKVGDVSTGRDEIEK